MKIAILYFQNTEPPLAGDTTHLSNLSRSLTLRGHEVKLLSLFGPQTKTSLWDARFKRAIYSAFILTQLSKLSQYDIVLFAEPPSPFNMILLRYLSFLNKAHIVLHDVGAPRIHSRLYYLPIRNRFPVLISGENARHFAESITTKVGLLPPGVDMARLRPLDMERKWDLLYIGHLYREKGVLLLLQAMKRLKDNGSPLKLKIICTPGAEEKFYRSYIRENGLDNVEMERTIITDHTSVYNSARVFVYPGISRSRVAQIPLTIVEASACGLPVVCTTLYRHIELPNITFADPTPESLADAILQVNHDWNLEKRDRTIAVTRERHSLTSMGSIAKSFFAEVIGVERE